MTKRFSPQLMAVLLGIILVVTACGSDDVSTIGSDSGGKRTIKVEMRDNAFAPTTVTATAGETVRFEFANVGEADHEAIIGDAQTQADHETEMNRAGSRGKGSQAADHRTMTENEGITVKPGDKGEITYTFQAGENLLIGCHEPGHYAAGMKLQVSPA